MHPYGVDTNERRNVLIFLVPISFLLSSASTTIVEWIGWSPPAEIEWIFDPASAAAWFGLLYLLVEERAWRWPVLRGVGLVQSPDLMGVWRGHLRSSYDEFASKKEIMVTVKQT